MVIVGAHGTILRHSDPRRGWEPESSGADDDLLSVTRGDAGYDFIAVGAHGRIVHRPNRGQPWSQMTAPDRNLHSVAASIPTDVRGRQQRGDLSKRY